MSLRMLSLVLLVVVLALAHHANAYHHCDNIKDSQLADVDEEWYLDQAAKGFHFVEQGNWNHLKDKTKWKWPKKHGKGRAAGSLQTLCYEWDGHLSTGNAKVPYSCTYTNINHQECEADFSKTDDAGVLAWGGQVKFLKTDHKTYIAGTFCLFSKVATYFIMTTTEEQLDPKIVADLGKHFKNIGFEQGQTSAKKGITALYMHNFKTVQCH